MAEFHINAGKAKVILGCCKIPSANGLDEKESFFFILQLFPLYYFAKDG
jgi:hypothetical protein